MNHNHHHGHGHHHHHHDHSHNHNHEGSEGRLRLAFFLNLGFAILEFAGGLWTNSMAIMSDAVHDMGDSLSLGVAWWLERKSKKPSSKSYSYGYKRLSLLAAMFTGLILLLGSVFIVWRAVPRILNPEAVHVHGMFIFAILGVAVNGYAAYKVSKGVGWNEKLIMWHLLEDVLGWVVILISSVVMMFVDIPQLDAILSVGISAWIIFNVFKNLSHVVKVFLQAAPEGVDVHLLRERLLAISGVLDVHHIHLWSLDGMKHIFTAHVAVAADSSLEKVAIIQANIKNELQTWGIFESTLEIEQFGQVCADPQHL